MIATAASAARLALPAGKKLSGAHCLQGNILRRSEG
jgi:hypothetical protein